MPGQPIESQYVEVRGSTMHYLEEGEGDPILFLHGNPTSSFIWRNVIPELSTLGRCIAPDLIGMGRSQKPDIEYRFFDHAKYIEEFVHALKLRNLAIVGHDWGGALGFYYAMHHERNVRAVAFFETIVRPLSWSDIPSEAKLAFRLFRMPLLGQLLIQGLNLFVQKVLPMGVKGKLDPVAFEEYARPFRTYGSRKPLWRMPNDVPIDGRPEDVADVAERWSAWLGRSEVPKLLLHGSPGGLIRTDTVSWCRANVRNLDVVDVGPGLHYLQEDQPAAVSRALAEWMQTEVIGEANPQR